jgi:hypothetical protein
LLDAALGPSDGVAQQDDTVAEPPVLHQLQVGRVVGGLEQSSTAADDDRVDVEPV